MPEYIKEALLEMGRVIVLALIPNFIVMLEAGKIDFKVLFVTGVIAFLRFVDKVLHLKGVEDENESLERGLVRF